ncbi:MAG: trypsin-like peptidase domain-containing protein [Pseudomonadota bacterium]
MDAALIRVENYTSQHFLPLNSRSQQDEWIAMAGYPGKAAEDDYRYTVLFSSLRRGQALNLGEVPTAVSSEGRINTLTINTTTRATDLLYSMPSGRGNSGSAVVNACGEVVGIHYAGSFSEVERGRDGKPVVKAVKYNRGVSMKDVVLFLDQIGSGIPYARTPCQVAF